MRISGAQKHSCVRIRVIERADAKGQILRLRQADRKEEGI